MALKYFLKNFYVHIHHKYWSLIFLFSSIPGWIIYEVKFNFVKWGWYCLYQKVFDTSIIHYAVLTPNMYVW